MTSAEFSKGLQRRRNTTRIVAGSLVVAAGCASHPSGGGSARPAISLDERDLRTWMSVIADDSMQGRDAGSIGHDRAVRYLVDQLTRIGLRPAGEDGAYLQHVPEVSLVVDTLTEFRIDTEKLTLGVDFRPFVGGRGPPRPIDGAEVIYGGVYGDTASQINRASADGRIVILSAPPGLTPALTFRWMIYPSDSRLGSAAAVAIESLDLFPIPQRTPFSANAVDAAESKRADSAPTTVQITSRAAVALLGAAPSTLKPGTLGRRVHGRFVFAELPRPSWNVAAILSGHGPRNGEIVALTAHSDHLGVARSVNADSIFNGADDNASGTVALLAVARALRSSRPARSVLFLWPTAEEHGMVGSRWFVGHPTVPLDSIVAVFNLDMVGRGEGPSWRKNPPNLLRTIITGAPPTLNAAIVGANALARRPLALDTSDVDRVFCSSDHAAFLRLSVPTAFFTTDKHVDYHRVTDERARIDYDRLRRVAELVATVVRSLADSAGRIAPSTASAHREACAS
jgi:peptidase M28-like protein